MEQAIVFYETFGVVHDVNECKGMVQGSSNFVYEYIHSPTRIPPASVCLIFWKKLSNICANGGKSTLVISNELIMYSITLSMNFHKVAAAIQKTAWILLYIVHMAW